VPVKYTYDDDGMRELGRSSGIQRATLDAAKAVQAFAAADNPRGTYEATPQTVTAGWQNDHRAGAAVTETKAGSGPQRRTLARAAEAARS